MPSKRRAWSVSAPSSCPIVDGRKKRSQSVPAHPPVPIKYKLKEPVQTETVAPRRRGRKYWRKDRFIRCYYPYENLRLANETEGAMKAVYRKVIDVIGDHIVQVDVPVKRMTELALKVHEKLSQSMEIGVGTAAYWNGSQAKMMRAADEDVWAAIDKILVEKDVEEFVDELQRYALIGSTQLDKLSLGSLLSMVLDVCRDGASLRESESGHPPRLATSLFKYYNLGQAEFNAHSEKGRDNMLETYIKEGIRYQRDMKVLLEEKYESLLKSGEMLDGSEQQEEWFRAFEKNQAMGRRMKKEYERIRQKEALKKGKDQIGIRPNDDEAMDYKEEAEQFIELSLPNIPNLQCSATPLMFEINPVQPSNIHF